MVYEGNDKYIFISYAHADGDKVLPIIEELAKDGYRLWYDSGIEAGTEWPEYIEERLTDAQVVLAFMSPAAVDSQNCRNEINFALELKKEVLVVYLEETVLRKGMRLQLNSTQSLFRNKHKTEASFIKELLNARILADCRTPKAAPPVPPVAPVSTLQPDTPVQHKQKSHSSALTMVGIVIGVIAMLLLAIVLIQDAVIKHNLETPPQTSATEPIATTEPLKMSEALFDFTIELEGNVYQLPCSFQDLASHGWTISTNGYSDTSMMMGGGYEQFDMTNNGKTITVSAYNPSGNATALKDCSITGLMYDATSNVSVKLAKDITVFSTVDEIIAAYGEPTDRNDATNYTTLIYQPADKEFSGYRFQIYPESAVWNYSSVEIEHIVPKEDDESQTNPQRPDYLDNYKAPTGLGEELYTSVFKLGEELYQLPCPVTTFLDNGWETTTRLSHVKAGDTDRLTLKLNGMEIDVYIANYSLYQTTPENCAIYKVIVRNADGISMELPGGIRLGMDISLLKTLVTEDFHYYEAASYCTWSYQESKPRDIYIHIEGDTGTGKIHALTISSDYWDYE